MKIIIYTDGSCNTQTCTGGWAAIILDGDNRTVLQGMEQKTTHNRMELTAVIKAIDFAVEHFPEATLDIYSDSQYVVKLVDRKDKLVSQKFITKKGTALNNSDLLQQLILHIEKYSISFFKVKAHQKTTSQENINKEVDIICRKIMREASNTIL